MSFSVNYLVFCVPTLHINNYRNRDIVLNALIAELITFGVKHHMAGKVPKPKDFYKVSLCSKTTASTCSSLSKLILMSSSMIGSLNLMDFNHCPLAWRSG